MTPEARDTSLTVGMVLFPNLTQLDLTGPYEVFARLPDTKVSLIAETITPHWLSLNLLALFGAEPVDGRVVIDRNRLTGGGFTAGIDFGLTVAAEVFGQEVAQEVQLALEYCPAPPLSSGSPKTAPAAVVKNVIAAREGIQSKRRQIAERAAARLGLRVG